MVQKTYIEYFSTTGRRGGINFSELVRTASKNIQNTSNEGYYFGSLEKSLTYLFKASYGYQIMVRILPKNW